MTRFSLCLLATSLLLFASSAFSQNCDEIVSLVNSHKTKTSCCMYDNSGTQENTLVKMNNKGDTTADQINKILAFGTKKKQFKKKYQSTGLNIWNKLKKRVTQCKKASNDRFVLGGGGGGNSNTDACDVAGDPAQQNSLSTRIINGDQCVVGESPVVYLLFSYNSSCTGSLIANTSGNAWVLTAAHCLQGSWQNNSTSVTVTSGNDEVDSSLAYFIETYDGNTAPYGKHDAALIRLPRPLDGAQTATLLTDDSVITDGAELVIAGYGRIGTGQAQDNNFDADLYAGTMEIDDNGQNDLGDTGVEEILANFNHSQNTGANTCNGDSGGPAFISDNGTYKIAGITSYGFSANCGPTDSSGFANVTDPDILNFICGRVVLDVCP
ncbi:MAG: trypsin-like serine protease [Bdellovibrionales bacterium]|nr:trypsin-like serine protease [Bdellovibrionales bacterium]